MTHGCVLQDPLPKPSYLFALVAGPLVLGAEGSFTSRITGKTTALRVYTPQGYADQVRQGCKRCQWLHRDQ
jgi:aminopeptidase N